MATAGTIAVNVVANTGGFAASMKQAQGALGGFGQSATGGLRSVASFGLGLAGIGGVAATAMLAIRSVGHALDDIDSKRDLAARLGATVQELRQLEFAAGQSGANMESLTTGLQKMLKTIGEARAGAKGPNEAIAALGLSVDNLAGMSSAESFMSIATAIKAIPNPADRAAAAMKIFGKGAGELIPLMLEGRDGIKGMGSEFDLLGGRISALDADKVDEFNDSVGRMKAGWGGFTSALGKSAVVTGPADMLGKIFAGWRIGLQGQAETTRQIKESIAQLNEVEIIPERGAENPLVKAARLAEEAKKLTQAKKELEKQFATGAAIASQFRTPLETMAVKMAELNTLREIGAIGWAHYQRAVAGATKEMEAAVAKEHELKGPGKTGAAAVTKGSAAAFAAIASARSEGKRQEEIAKKSLEVEKKMELLLKAIDANTKTKIIVHEGGV